MSIRVYKLSLIAIALMFTLFFALIIIPPLLEHFDIWAAIFAGFVNPYASGYATDVILCWFILMVWIVYEAKVHAIRHGWVCLLLGLIPGVAVGFALYLLMRLSHFEKSVKPNIE